MSVPPSPAEPCGICDLNSAVILYRLSPDAGHVDGLTEVAVCNLCRDDIESEATLESKKRSLIARALLNITAATGKPASTFSSKQVLEHMGRAVEEFLTASRTAEPLHAPVV